jgi:hypothetical protein
LGSSGEVTSAAQTLKSFSFASKMSPIIECSVQITTGKTVTITVANPVVTKTTVPDNVIPVGKKSDPRNNGGSAGIIVIVVVLVLCAFAVAGYKYRDSKHVVVVRRTVGAFAAAGCKYVHPASGAAKYEGSEKEVEMNRVNPMPDSKASLGGRGGSNYVVVAKDTMSNTVHD